MKRYLRWLLNPELIFHIETLKELFLQARQSNEPQSTDKKK